MTPSDLDVELDRLRAAVERVGANLVALEQDPTVALLDVADLRGESAERWHAARVALADLFASYRALAAVVARADVLRGPGRRLTAPRAHQLVELVRGRSVVVAGATVALADRGLLASSRTATTWTPTALLDVMATSFDEIRGVVATAARTWEVAVARTTALRARLAALTGTEPSPASLGAELDEIAADVLADPLALDWSRLDRLGVAIDALERDSIATAELRDDLTVTISAARTLLDEAAAAVGAAADTVARIRARIVVAPGPAPIDPLDDLAADLARIAAHAADGRWSEAAVQLAGWRTAVADRRSAAGRCAAEHEGLLLHRLELRGRLDAYRAKADREGRLEDPAATARYIEAHDALHTAPTDLDAAAGLVRRYQDALAAPRPVPTRELR
jgi:hypothetical protein